MNYIKRLIEKIKTYCNCQRSRHWWEEDTYSEYKKCKHCGGLEKIDYYFDDAQEYSHHVNKIKELKQRAKLLELERETCASADMWFLH